MEPSFLLEEFYVRTMEIVGSDDEIKSDLSENVMLHLDEILNRSESSKGVLTVVFNESSL